MTREELAAKNQIIKILQKEQYGRYAKLMEKFFIELTSRPDIIGAVNLQNGVMILNRGLDESQISVVVRHEIMHQYLDHVNRLINHLAQKEGFDPEELTDMNFKELAHKLLSNKTFNIAGDYEISNKMYTEADKDMIRTMHALVTEDDHPDWINLSVEEMYDKLEAMRPPKIMNVFGVFEDPTTFTGIDGVTYGA